MRSAMAEASRSSAANARREARASLAEPSRPFTPANSSRSLFHNSGSISGNVGGGVSAAELANRPTSSFHINRELFGTSMAPVPRPTSMYGGAEVFSLDASLPSSLPYPAAEAPSVSSYGSSNSSSSGGGGRGGSSSSGAAAAVLPPPPPVPGAPAGAPAAALPPPPAIGPAGADENIMPVEQQAWWAETQGLLAELRPDAALEPLLRSCDALWERLREPASSAGPAGVPPVFGEELAARRKCILAAAGGLMDRREGPLLLRLCRLILGARADRSAQLGACKLLFRLSKSESNDRRFRELGLLPLLLAVLSQGDAKGSEAMVFAAGALKNVSADASNQKALVQLHAVGILSQAVKQQTDQMLAAPPTPRPGGSAAAAKEASVRPAHLLVQLTATLRNVAVSGSSRKQFVSTSCVEELCALLRAAPHHAELCLNVSRVLAKLSLHEDVRQRLDAREEHLDALLQALALHSQDRPLLIRLCFILGNLSAAHPPNREAIARLALPRLLGLLESHAEELLARTSRGHAASVHERSMGAQASAHHDAAAGGARDDASTRELAAGIDPAAADARDGATNREGPGGGRGDVEGGKHAERPAGGTEGVGSEGDCGEGGEGGDAGSSGSGGEAAELLDVLVKLVRLIAHLAISPHIGERIATAPASLALLRLLQGTRVAGDDELHLNVVSAVTNLSYYLVDGSVLLRSHETLCMALVPALTFPNAEGQVEAARALGNLSRLPEARHTICRVRVHEALLLLLDHSSSHVAEAACGALINLAADPPMRAALIEVGGAAKLAGLLLYLLSSAPPVPVDEAAAAEAIASDVGAALLAAKTLCNLCCGVSVNPLDTTLTCELRARLVEPRPAAWRFAADSAPLLAEWPQAASLLLELVGRLPTADDGANGAFGEEGAFADEGDEYEAALVDEYEMLPVR